ncbi:MAG: hypothetical protein II131_00530, partial [Neisseriaceae bacterium]|nr:hypothetical protein [Neisseriaceae bacterium]
VYLPDYYGTVALIAKQLRAQGIKVPLIGGDGWDGLTVVHFLSAYIIFRLPETFQAAFGFY